MLNVHIGSHPPQDQSTCQLLGWELSFQLGELVGNLVLVTDTYYLRTNLFFSSVDPTRETEKISY